MTPTALFDLDGTLVDSAPDLHAAVNRLMAARGLPDFALPEIVAMVGDGARALVERVLAARGQTWDEAALDDFLADYTRNAAVLTRPSRASPRRSTRWPRPDGGSPSAPTSRRPRRARCWANSACCRASPPWAGAIPSPCASRIPTICARRSPPRAVRPGAR
jgi:hypothetical protein